MDNDALSREFDFYRNVSPKSTNQAARDAYLLELENLFNQADKNHDHRVSREEFERLIGGYFEMKGIKQTKENYDKYFEQLDINHDHGITQKEFVDFSDGVVENDIIPFI